jgi:hypothetical protein
MVGYFGSQCGADSVLISAEGQVGKRGSALIADNHEAQHPNIEIGGWSTRCSAIHRSLRSDVTRCGLLFAEDMNFFNKISRRMSTLRASVDAGMSTAEYAVGTVAAVAFAVVLYKVVTSGEVQAELADIVRSALHAS